MKINFFISKEGERRLSCLIFILCFNAIVILPNISFAKMPMGSSILPEEMKALPRWCQIRMRSHAAMRGYKGSHALAERVPEWVLRENKKWEKVIGKEIYNFCHHYAYALNWINRYKRFRFSQYKGADRDRTWALSKAISDFNFMRGRMGPQHKLYYPMLMHEAYVFKELKQYRKAINNYKEIVKLKPSYARGYVEYAQLLKNNGKRADAKKVLQIGLKKTKGAKSIKQSIVALESKEGNN